VAVSATLLKGVPLANIATGEVGVREAQGDIRMSRATERKSKESEIRD
jgi:hypothetical protein